MKNFRTFENTSVTVIAALLTAALLNPDALKNWAKSLQVGWSQEQGLALVHLAEVLAEPYGLNIPAREIHNGFVSVRQSYRFVFLSVPNAPQRLAGRTPVIQNPIESSPNPVKSMVFASQPLLLPAQPLVGSIPVSAPVSAPTSVPVPSAQPSTSVATEVSLHANRAPAAQSQSHRVLAIGDSLLKTILSFKLRETLSKEMPDASLEVFERIATGLSSPDQFDWQAKAQELTANSRYDATFVVLGTNDTQEFKIDGKTRKFGSDEWNKVYASRVKSLIETLCKASTKVYWLAAPPMRDSDFDQRIAALNALVRTSIRRQPNSCARFLPTIPVLGGEDGKFASYLEVEGKHVKVRERDGIHLTFGGADLLSNYLVGKLRQDFPQ